MMMTTNALYLLLLAAVAVAQDPPRNNNNNNNNKGGCEGGACPFDYGSKKQEESASRESDSSCGMWLGPSHIKKAFNHGFGYGIYTGKAIPEGTPIEPLYNGANGRVGEPLLPFFGSEAIYKEHSPLREYIWDEDNMPEVAVEYPDGLTALFIPGLAAIAPCTSVNFNLEIMGPGKEDGERQSVVSSTSIPDNGAYAVRHNVTYVAVRDIWAGEELTVQCSDDDYNGGAYYLSTYDKDDDRVVCLDQNVRVDVSSIQGHGLFAKRVLEQNTTVLSSPVLPIHGSELEQENLDVNEDQLLVNYCYGHPDSDLLWLPYGPMMSYLNHSPKPNARLQWHTGPQSDVNQKPHARQQHHHPELFTMSGDDVSRTHGKSLTLDIVPLRTIQPGEEITIDYGKEWVDAWEKNVKLKDMQSKIKKPKQGDDNYVTAEVFNARVQRPVYKTVLEQLRNPYPDNLETFCFYGQPDLAPEGHDHAHKHKHVTTHAWDSTEDHECFRPCQILERNENMYTVKIFQSDDRRIVDQCILDDHDEIWTDVPVEAVRVVDRPYTTEVFSQDAFRREIGLPDDMVPASWKRKKLRTRSSGTHFVQLGGDEFKRKKVVLEVKPKGAVTKH